MIKLLKILLKISKYLEKIVTLFGKIGSWLAIPLISIIIFDIITSQLFIYLRPIRLYLYYLIGRIVSQSKISILKDQENAIDN